MKPAEARKIVTEVKQIDAQESGSSRGRNSPRMYQIKPATSDPSEMTTSETAKKASLPTVGTALGYAVEMTGAFDLLADVTGALLHGKAGQIVPSLDSITIVV